MTGRVKWFNNEKGYGFIGFRENEDIFVHYSAIELEGYKTLSENQLVEFKLIETSKGYQAINVRLLKETTTVWISGFYNEKNKKQKRRAIIKSMWYT